MQILVLEEQTVAVDDREEWKAVFESGNGKATKFLGYI